jgi:hypothetical protein
MATSKWSGQWKETRHKQARFLAAIQRIKVNRPAATSEPDDSKGHVPDRNY